MNQQVTQQWASFEQFLTAILNEGRNDQVDARLKFEAAPTGQNEGIGAAGGFLVPREFAQALWTRVYGTGRILARCDRQPVTRGDRLTIPQISEDARGDGEQPTGSRFGGAQMYWTDEAGTGNDSKMEFDLLTLKLKKLLGLFYATDELADDAPGLVVALKRIFGLEASFAIEDAIVTGDGIAKPLGILNSEALLTVAKEGGQAPNTVNVLNLQNMAKGLWGPSHATAIWMMGNDAYGKILEIESTDGIQLFETGPNGERMLLQMPVELCEYTPALSSAGDILLADLSQYVLAEKEANGNLLSSLHVKFISDEHAFKLRYRVDGAPAWKTPITPNNSANKQSPFVALGAR